MPEVAENMDKQRLAEVRKLSLRAVRIWLDMNSAAERNDNEACRKVYGEARAVTIEVSDILKALGAERGNG